MGDDPGAGRALRRPGKPGPQFPGPQACRSRTGARGTLGRGTRSPAPLLAMPGVRMRCNPSLLASPLLAGPHGREGRPRSPSCGLAPGL